MIYNQKYTLNRDRESALEYLQNLQNKTSYKLRVLDVGGWHSLWASKFVTHVIDIHEVPATNFYLGNINMPEVWQEIAEDVKQKGLFDFCICTHTLEDIANPRLAIERMPQIAKEGYIAIPSKYNELRFNQYGFRGSIHHRWIFNIEKNNSIVDYPKVNFTERSSDSDIIGGLSKKENDELQFFWKKEVPISFVNDDYLGPSDSAVFNYYRNLVD